MEEKQVEIPGINPEGNVDTGDTSNTTLWIQALLASLGLGALVTRKKRVRKD